MAIYLVKDTRSTDVHGTDSKKKTGCGINLTKAENLVRYDIGGECLDVKEITCMKCKEVLVKKFIRESNKREARELKEEKKRIKKSGGSVEEEDFGSGRFNPLGMLSSFIGGGKKSETADSATNEHIKSIEKRIYGDEDDEDEDVRSSVPRYMDVPPYDREEEKLPEAPEIVETPVVEETDKPEVEEVEEVEETIQEVVKEEPKTERPKKTPKKTASRKFDADSLDDMLNKYLRSSHHERPKKEEELAPPPKKAIDDDFSKSMIEDLGIEDIGEIEVPTLASVKPELEETPINNVVDIEDLDKVEVPALEEIISESEEEPESEVLGMDDFGEIEVPTLASAKPEPKEEPETEVLGMDDFGEIEVPTLASAKPEPEEEPESEVLRMDDLGEIEVPTLASAKPEPEEEPESEVLGMDDLGEIEVPTLASAKPEPEEEPETEVLGMDDLGEIEVPTLASAKPEPQEEPANNVVDIADLDNIEVPTLSEIVPDIVPVEEEAKADEVVDVLQMGDISDSEILEKNEQEKTEADTLDKIAENLFKDDKQKEYVTDEAKMFQTITITGKEHNESVNGIVSVEDLMADIANNPEAQQTVLNDRRETAEKGKENLVDVIESLRKVTDDLQSVQKAQEKQVEHMENVTNSQAVISSQTVQAMRTVQSIQQQSAEMPQMQNIVPPTMQQIQQQMPQQPIQNIVTPVQQPVQTVVTPQPMPQQPVQNMVTPVQQPNIIPPQPVVVQQPVVTNQIVYNDNQPHQVMYNQYGQPFIYNNLGQPIMLQYNNQGKLVVPQQASESKKEPDTHYGNVNVSVLSFEEPKSESPILGNLNKKSGQAQILDSIEDVLSAVTGEEYSKSEEEKEIKLDFQEYIPTKNEPKKTVKKKPVEKKPLTKKEQKALERRKKEDEKFKKELEKKGIKFE